MLSNVLKNASFYLEYYHNFIVNSWENITFWQYVALMVFVLAIGYLWMSKGAEGRT